MLFSNSIFVFAFLPIVFLSFFFLKNVDKVGLLILASFVFYGFWNIYLLPLLAGSIFVNFLISNLFKKGKKTNKKTYLILGILFNLGLLGYFKYKNFFLENACLLFDCNFQFQQLTLPLGISFFTFQQISFLVDRYKTHQKHVSFHEYILFVSFFPQLIAGPIVSHHELIPQIKRLTHKVSDDYLWRGIVIFCIGLFKKLVIADQLAQNVNPVFLVADKGEAITFVDAWIGTLSFSFQIYFDFSAYSDMAIGLGLLFGIVLPINFNSPYKASNIQDFWRTWHMTLSRFLKDRVYIPMGGNKFGTFGTYRNLFLTMIIGGLWHGAHWNFVIWGGLHGAFLCLHRAFLKLEIFKEISISFLERILTFTFVVMVWVFFRAETFDGAVNVFKGLIGLNGIAFPYELYLKDSTPEILKTLNFIEWKPTTLGMISLKTGLPSLFILLLWVWFLPNAWQLIGLTEKSCDQAANNQKVVFEKTKLNGCMLTVVFTACVFIFACLFMGEPAEFIYFEF